EPAPDTPPAESTDPAAAAGVPTPVGPRSYTPEDFARFAPRTALDLITRVPGFSIRNAPQERGLGQASANVLLNGRRIGGKADDVVSQLGRIPAANVVRVEIRDGAELDVPGLSGEVANVVTRATSQTSGQFSWRPEFRAHHTDPLFTRFEVSVSGTQGPVEYTLGLDNQASRSGAGGFTEILGPGRVFRELRDDHWTSNGDLPRLSGRFVLDGPGSSVGNLNFYYRQYWSDYDELGLRTGPGLPDRERTVVQDIHGYDYEIGGDFEFAVGPGRLKLVGLNRFDHEPFEQTVVVDYLDATPSTGNRFARIADMSERIARTEYRLPVAGGDFQLSGEAAFNTLDSESALFVLEPSGEFEEVPLPGGSGRVEEDRYEVMASFGRPISPALSFQLSAGGEYSQLSQVGPGGLTRSFWRPKGQLSLAWRPTPLWNTSLRLQRRVGQLNFGDFLQSVNLNDDRENAGNPELVPPQSWELDVEAIRNLGRYGTTTLRLYGRWYDDIVDTIPIGPDGESPGNIDHAVAYGVEWKTTFNFDPMGWRGARLDARLQLQRSRVDDPLTGEPRSISGFLLRAVELGLRHDIPETDWAWGFSLNNALAALNVRLTEVGRQWEGPVWTSV
ncbi:TonB-dependent receptor plug domain-containing protein, partial [Allosphingosinicella sp.]|uniref:TonB-dependent receptor plug domain-containing protein n=1 Tax=Allosphingosinicella sp. TaxID=2823234 RepID=UPI002EF723EB